MNRLKHHFFLISLTLIILMTMGGGAVLAENIDPGNYGSKYVWGENVGWLNLKPSQGPGVTVTSSSMSGYIWGENIGWINLSCLNEGSCTTAIFGVLNDGNGNLSGYAWGENVGWINFAPTGGGVTINACGEFNGSAWGENIGWISFRSGGANPFKLTTAWQSPLDNVPPVTSYFPTVQPWYKTDAVFNFSSSDCGQGTKEVRYQINSGPEIVTAGTHVTATVTPEGCNILEYYAIDLANNIEPSRNMTVCIDKTPPAINISVPANGSTFNINQPLLANFTVTDLLSGLASVTSSVPLGSAINTTATGNYTFNVTATDNAGNTTPLTYSYSVIFPGNMDPGSAGCQYAWAENVGWINFQPSWGPGVTVTDTAVTGMAWGENIGWINLSPSNGRGGVVNDSAGHLSGYAWGENVGWIKFNPVSGGVSIGNDGKFTGYAWGENIGWINFSAVNTCVKTAWAPPDITVDPFTFLPQTGVTLNTPVISNTITVSGINRRVPISITGGEYSINGGIYTAVSNTTVANGDTVSVRQTSSGSYSRMTNAILTIGSVSGIFSVTTLAADITPDPFSFIPQTDIALNAVVISNSIYVSGINTLASISITGGKYLINNGLFTDAPGMVNIGDTVRIDLTASGNYGATTSATLSIGGVSGTFSVTTLSGPVVPPTSSLDLSLTMTGTGTGIITFSPGYNCSGTCKQEYGSGATVMLDAVATSNGTFNGWTGCDAVNGTTCMVSMTSVRSVSANFSRQGTGTGTVYGRITDSSGSGVANASVGMTREYDNETCSGANCIHASTNSSGNYLISNIVPGTYTLSFNNQMVPYGTSGGFISTMNQWYNNKHSIASADLIPISEGGQWEFDAVFPPFGQIAGTVTDTNGAGIANVDAMVFDLYEQYIDDGYTDASGNYAAQHLPTGTYKIRFRANIKSGLNAAQNLVTQAAYVTVTAPDIVTGINATMSPGRSISGTLTDKDGLPITAGVHVIDSNALNIAGATTDATGAYTIIGIPPGSYKVLFMPTLPATGVVDVTRLYSRKFYGGSADYDSASLVTVTADADVSNIDGVLEVNGPSINSSWIAVAAVRYKWDFGVEVVGMSSYRSIMLANLGTADLSLGALAVIGQGFSILNDRCSGVTLAPQELCTLQVSFVPQSEGMKTGAINVPSNDPNVPVFTISLTGSGGAATGNSGAIAVPYGNNIAVAPTSEVNLTFTSVTSAEGMATATAITTLTFPVPSDSRMLNGTSYDITTTAPYSGPINVCIKYDPATMANPSNEQNLKLLHLNGSAWQDITKSVDTIAKKVCGLTDSLSPFLIAEPTTDTTPDPFSFIDQSGVALNTVMTSNAITVSGINAPSAISVNGGQYSINNGAFISAAGTVNNGDSVSVQLTSAAAYATTKNATLTIGGVSGTFSVTTQSVPVDTTPDQFSFVDQTGVALNTVITSNTITVSGINAPAPISITSGLYSINGSAFTSAAGTVNNGNSVRVQLTSSLNYATMTSATLTISGVSGTFSVTTMSNTGYFTITASAGPNGSILPSGAVSVRKGAIQIFLIIPNMGYHVADVLVDGVSMGAQLLYTFKNVQANHTISATFAANTGNTITASAGPNGSISPSGAVTVLNWASQTFTITPDAGYRVADVLVDGKSVGARTSYTFYLVRADHTISASFTPDVYTITATAGPNGSISPSGAVTMHRGDNATFTITPDTGHLVRRVVVDGDNKGAIKSYTFKNVRANHTIDVYFK